MRPPRFAVNIGERYLPFREPSNCVVSILKGEEHLLHRNRHRVFGKSCPSHGLKDFGDGHPVGDFVGPPRVVFGVPQFIVITQPSDDLQSFHIGNQHGFAILGHLVLGSYPRHGLGFFSVEDMAEQHPIHPPRGNGFGMVGG